MLNAVRRTDSDIDLCNELLVKREEPFVLAAYPRSGTNWLSKILSANGIILGTEPFSLHLSPQHPLRNAGTELWGSELQVSGSPIVDGILDTLRDSKSSEIGFKEVNFGLRLKWLLEQVSAIQVIALVRDPLWVCSSFKENNFWESWQYDQRFEKVAALVENESRLAPFKRSLAEVDRNSWSSKNAFLWVVDTLLVQKISADFDRTLTTVGYEQLASGDSAAWNDLSIALNRQLRLPDKNGACVDGHVRSTKDPHSVLLPGPQMMQQRKVPTSLSVEEVRDILQVVEHAPLYMLGTQIKSQLEHSCPSLIIERSAPTEMQELRLSTGYTIKISKGLIRAAEFCTFLNETRHEPNSDYSGYHYHAGNALLEYDSNLNRWRVKTGFENHPISNLTHECANQFARYYNARLPTLPEMEAILSAVAPESPASLIGKANIGGAHNGPTPVGAMEEDSLGLFDVIGNLYEWVDEPATMALRVGSSFRSSLSDGVLLNPTPCWSVLASHTTGFRIVYDQY